MKPVMTCKLAFRIEYFKSRYYNQFMYMNILWLISFNLVLNACSRAPAQKASAAALLAERGRYESAIALLESIVSVCAQDEIRSYKVKDYLYLEALCMIGLEDWVRLGKSVRAWDGKYQGDKWTKSRECRFIKVCN